MPGVGRGARQLVTIREGNPTLRVRSLEPLYRMFALRLKAKQDTASRCPCDTKATKPVSTRVPLGAGGAHAISRAASN